MILLCVLYFFYRFVRNPESTRSLTNALKYDIGFKYDHKQNCLGFNIEHLPIHSLTSKSLEYLYIILDTIYHNSR